MLQYSMASAEKFLGGGSSGKEIEK